MTNSRKDALVCRAWQMPGSCCGTDQPSWAGIHLNIFSVRFCEALHQQQRERFSNVSHRARILQATSQYASPDKGARMCISVQVRKVSWHKLSVYQCLLSCYCVNVCLCQKALQPLEIAVQRFEP